MALRVITDIWRLRREGVVVRYDHGPAPMSPGLFTCTEHGEQREVRLEDWVYEPENACPHVKMIGKGNQFWTRGPDR